MSDLDEEYRGRGGGSRNRPHGNLNFLRLAVIALFFTLTIVFGANPYERLGWIPADGRGMNPQLQNPGMAIHPPNLYLGYIATSIPFAYAVAALITLQSATPNVMTRVRENRSASRPQGSAASV